MKPLFSPETRRRLHETHPKWHLKAILQATCASLAFLALILFADATALTNKYFPSPHGDWSDWMPLFPVIISLLYNPLSFLYLLSNNPLHPGWDVGVYLLIWALAIPSIVFSVGLGWFWWWQPVLQEYDGYILCNQWNLWSEPCNPVIYTAGKIEIAANVFLGLLIILTFTLFVLACVATHKHRRAQRTAKVASRNIRLQYHRSPEEHAVARLEPQQPPAYSPRADGDDEERGMPVGATKYA
ncbi:MAG: hypothetical protein LQ338_002473 [Usnochroma carphineum]|nr:MAG: hypothetical protein LQ338_002473 [Usnochroma carphineum]